MFMNWTDDPVLDAERYNAMLEERQRSEELEDGDDWRIGNGDNGFLQRK